MTKLSKLLGFMERGEWKKALSLASKFPQLGAHRDDIIRGHEADIYPGFYRQLKKDPDELVRIGIIALLKRYKTNKDSRHA